MTYARGWWEACDALEQRIQRADPEGMNVLLPVQAVQQMIGSIRSLGYQPAPVRDLTDWEQQLVKYGLEP